ncbi:MAG: hypothetical protein AB9M60_00690 [Leptothrix sp. (in: b-proteobacteria)]
MNTPITTPAQADPLSVLHKLLADIATSASTARELLAVSADSPAEHAVLDLLSLIGWKADLGTQLAGTTGRPEVLGDARDWLLDAHIREALAAASRHTGGAAA